MPYSASKKLGGEIASKLGHLEIVKNPLVREIVKQLEEDSNLQKIIPSLEWRPLPEKDALKIIFVVDGSYQVVKSERYPYKEVAFIKTVLLRYNHNEFEKLDPVTPHPMALRDILSNAALYHATVLPLRGIKLKEKQLYHALREIIFTSFNDSTLKGEPYNTLKWLAYEKWTGEKTRSPKFECPHCKREIPGLPYNADKDLCPYCKEEVYLTDMIGFHLEMDDDYAPESIVSAYMLVHETLMLFTAIRIIWENYIERINHVLFLKDGPLSLRGQYSKLVIPVRKFFKFALDRGYRIHVIGQEKTGLFVDHFKAIQENVPDNHYAILNESYIRSEIQHNPRAKEPYGLRTNYGGKVFLKLSKNQFYVLNVALKEYTSNPEKTDFIGLEDSISTIPLLKNYKHENALTPIVLANGIASLSSYPSATILKLFAGI